MKITTDDLRMILSRIEILEKSGIRGVDSFLIGFDCMKVVLGHDYIGDDVQYYVKELVWLPGS